MLKRPTKKYLNAIGALYGSQKVLPSGYPSGEEIKTYHGSAIKKKGIRKDEDYEQILFNRWFDKFLWDKGCRWFHPPNGGHRAMSEGVKLKAMGVKRGVPDIIVPMSNKKNGCHGLVIELKRADGVPSDVRPEQREWLDWFEGQGWEARVAYGFEQAKEFVKGYLI